MAYSFDKISIFIIPPTLSLLIGLTIAFISVIKGKLKLENVLFFIVCIWWSLLDIAFISHHVFKGDTALILSIERVIHFFYVYIPFVNLLYFYRITETKSRYLVPGAFGLSLLFSLFTVVPFLRDFYFTGMYTYGWGYIMKGGIAFQLFSLYGTVVVAYFIIFFIRKLRSEKNQIIRLKLKYILLSFLLSGLLTITNIPAMNGVDFYPLGNMTFLPLAFLAYGVMSHRLMDIRSVLHVTLIWAIMSSLIVVPNIILFYLAYPYLTNFSEPVRFVIATAWFVADYLYLIRVQPLIDQLFNRRKYDLRRIESLFIEEIASLATIEELVALFTDRIKSTLFFKRADMVICHPDAALPQGEGECRIAPEIRSWLTARNHLVDRDMIASRADYAEVRSGLGELLGRYNAKFMVPIIQKEQLLAMLFLPEKQNLRQLAAFEVEFINNIRMAAAIALENSIMFSNLAHMKENLEKMVEERTAELLRAMKELWGEMELAKKIQTVLLPRSPEIAGFDIAAYMRPADQVGGDYYDVINAEGLDWIVIGDVSGHGIPAGLIMMMVQTAIHTVIAGRPNLKPEAVLSRVNSVISQNIRKLDEDKYMTITVIACMNNGSFFFSGLHQDMMIYRAAYGEVETVESNGIWIGIDEDLKPPAGGGFSMAVGDALLLYTDGITESWRRDSVRDKRVPERDMYGVERLTELFRELGKNAPDEIKDGIMADLDGFELNDDVTMMIVRKKE